jgi:serine/threonine-protein kinase
MYPQVFGKYVLERELARGGMARVVLATLRGAGGFEKRLVVKQIRDELASDDEFVRRFVDEAKTTVALAHPNIVPVYELGVEQGTYFLAMEWVQGASVAELLRACAPRGLSPEEGAYIGIEVCRALDYAHRRMNLVHRDVTPRNVMVDEEGQVKVIDFGIAAPVTTASGQGVFGSPGHMPPEQMAGMTPAATADVFAVAVLLMEVWSGKALFRRHTSADIEAAMRGPRPLPSDIQPRLRPLDEIITSALSLDAAARPQQADDLGRSLRRFLAGVDLGDLARQLGESVRSAARIQPAEAAAQEGRSLQRPPSRPTAMQMSSRTFAARAEVDGGSATRPIETQPKPRHAPTPRRRFAWGLVGASAATVGLGSVSVIVALFATKERTFGSQRPIAPPAVGIAGAGPASGDPLGATGSAPSPSSPPSPSATDREPLGRATGRPPDSAALVLLGNGATVEVDGVSRGPCPARVALAPGLHSVRFSFPVTGETKTQTLILHSHERAMLRADFTGATPTVRLERSEGLERSERQDLSP